MQARKLEWCHCEDACELSETDCQLFKANECFPTTSEKDKHSPSFDYRKEKKKQLNFNMRSLNLT